MSTKMDPTTNPSETNRLVNIELNTDVETNKLLFLRIDQSKLTKFRHFSSSSNWFLIATFASTVKLINSYETFSIQKCLTDEPCGVRYDNFIPKLTPPPPDYNFFISVSEWFFCSKLNN